MAKIERLNKTIIPNLVSTSSISAAGAGGRALAQLGGQAADVAQGFQDAKDATFVSERGTQYERDVDQFFDEYQAGAETDPDGARKGFQEFLNTRFRELSDGGSDRAIGELNLIRDDIDFKYGQKYSDFAQKQNVSNFNTSFDNTIKDTSLLAFRAGERGEPLGDIPRNIDMAMLAGTTYLSEGDLSALGEESRSTVTQEYLQGLIKINPAEAQRRISGGEFDNVLDVDQIQALGKVASAGVEDAEAEIKKQEVKAKNELSSNLNLKVTTAGTLAELESVSQEVEAQGETLGVIDANKLKAKIFSAQKEFREKASSEARGQQFASGELVLNPTNSKDKKSYNDYYETLTEELETLTPEEQNVAKARIIDNARTVPDRVKGELSLAARSQDAEEITNAADFIDRITAINPHLIGDLGSESDLARIQMVNLRVDAGIPPNKAIEQVDRILDPKNKPSEDAIQAELKDIRKTFKYRKEAIGNFDTLFTFAPREEGTFVTPELDGLSARYRVAFDDHYRITRDKDVSKDYADKVIKGSYGNSNVNGFKQITQFPAEQYYSIQGENNKWMRKQMIDEAIESTKGGLEPITKKDIEENLRLVVDPRVTPRSAAEGQPLYKLFLIRGDAPIDILNGKFFKFDPDKRRKQLIENAKKK